MTRLQPTPLPPIAKMTEAQLEEALKDPRWRLQALYSITNKQRQKVLFSPNEVQRAFLDNIWYRNVVPKARQRGFSTVVQLVGLDTCLFVPNTAAAVIAQDDAAARTIFDSKVKYAYDNLPAVIREMVPLRYDTKTELEFSNGSKMRVATSARGGTLQFLHVSEYGITCAKYPDRAEEIQKGSLPSVDKHGIVVVESTIETPFGPFADMVRHAMALQEAGRQLSEADYKLHFASWWDSEEYELDPAHVVISPQDNAYFERLEAAIRRPISAAKRAWYVATRENAFAGDATKMWSQYPSTLPEAFTVSTEGLWLSDQLARARRENRITDVPFVAGEPVNTWWDLGVDDDVATWCHQDVGPRNHFINYNEGASEPYGFYVRWLQQQQAERGYVWGKHFLPHDGAHRKPGAEILKTTKDMLEDLGLKNVEIVPRIAEVQTGVQQMRDAFSTYYFDEKNTAVGIKHLEGFSKVWNERMGTWSPIIAKNGHQHAADALRQHGQWRHTMMPGSVRAGQRPNRKNKSGMAA